MKEWIVIHQIKSLYNDGNGLSVHKIAKQLNISRNTVSKYLAMSAEEIAALKADTDRPKKLDEYRDYIVQLLQTYPGLSAVKVLRKLKAKVDDLAVSDRSMRRYIQALKQEISFKQPRYYEPVLDMLPGEQCQVDGGELRSVMIAGQPTTLYFMVFVLSYSRLMHVSVSPRPISTDTLIRQHDAAFRYFGGQPTECVYDQTKLVVISEVFRELRLNQRFHQYATSAGFQIRVCEGYDPESKGKVEAGVKYVKHNGLYGEIFADWKALECYMADWLDNTANHRLHGSTGQMPREHYEQQERCKMQPYLSPACIETLPATVTRKADKTGLIAWQSNKYSVPLAYQGARVGVCAEDGLLRISDLATGKTIAEHTLCQDKGQVIKNTDHYRDKQLQQNSLEQALQQLLGNVERATALCALLQVTSPKIYKDQLAGAKQVLQAHISQYGAISAALWARLIDTPRLTATGLRERLEAYQAHPERLQTDTAMVVNTDLADLAHYAALNGHSSGQGECHVIH